MAVTKQKKEVRRPLKPRDYKFLKAKASNPDMSDYKAAMVATGTTDLKVASVQAVRMLENVSLREAIDETMLRLGFTMDNVVAPVKEALEYTNDESARDQMEMRLKGHDRAIKLLQIAGGETEKTANNTINFNFGSKSQ